MLVTGHRLLDVAKRHRFAVPAFNISDWAMCQGIFEISEQLLAPLIIAIHPDELDHLGIDLMPAVIRRAQRSSVPVAVHLDHGAGYEQIQVAIQAGFTSVMIDGSVLPFSENVALTRQVTRAAHAVGTCHGIYPSWMTPEIRLDLLQQIASKVTVPLVLHGGSANPDEEIAEAVALGTSKINISSDIKVAYHATMRQVLQDLGVREPNVIQPPCVRAMQAAAANKIRLFAAEGKAALF